MQQQEQSDPGLRGDCVQTPWGQNQLSYNPYVRKTDTYVRAGDYQERPLTHDNKCSQRVFAE